MSDPDGNFMWTPPPSPSLSTILTMLNQTDDDRNLINEIFPQVNLSRNHNDHSERRPGLRERLASRTGFNPPTIETRNINPFAWSFENQTIPSPVTAISPVFSPSILLQSPLFSNSSQIGLPYLNTNHGPLEMVESSNEGNATTLILNDDDLLNQLLSFDLPTQGGVTSFAHDYVGEVTNDLPHQTSNNVHLLSQEESNVEPLSAPLVDWLEHDVDVVDNVHTDFTHQSLNVAVDEPNNDVNHQPMNFYMPSEEVAVDEAINNDVNHQPMNFYMPSEEDDDFFYIPASPDIGALLLANVESDIVDKANNDISHHALNVEQPPQEGLYNIPSDGSRVEPFSAHLVASSESNLPPYQEESDAVNEANIISMEEESEGKEQQENVEEKVVDHEDVDELNAGSSSSKKRKFEGTNMFGITRKNKTQRVIIQMESEEDNPDDGYRWRKYGRKIVKGNPNPRGYYRCNIKGCEVKKLIERGANDVRLVITTYDGIHNHPIPPVRRKGVGSRSMILSDSSMSQTHQINNPTTTTSLLSVPPPSFLTSTDINAPSSSLGPQTNMTKLFMTGLSKLPSLLPVYHQNGESMVDAIPDRAVVYDRIMNHVCTNFGSRLSVDMM